MNLTWDDYGEIRSAIYRGDSKTELKSLAVLPSKAEIKAAIDFVATAIDNNKAAVKSGIDSALGVSTTPELAATIFKEVVSLYVRRY